MSDKKNERDRLVSLLTSSGSNDDLPSSKLGVKKFQIICLFVIFLLAILVLLAIFNKARPVVANENKTNIEVNPQAEKTKISESLQPTSHVSAGDDVALNAAGFIVARRVATASSEVMGVLKSVDVDEGMHVVKGDVLATVNSGVLNKDLELALHEKNLAQLQYKRLKAELMESIKQYERLDVLRKNGLVAISDFETEELKQNILKLRVQEAEIQIELATTRLERLDKELEKYTIRAPFSGVIIGKNAQPGEIVSPSSAGGGFTRTGICTIVDMSSLEIEVDINERFLQKIAVNQRVIANLDAYPEWKIPGSVIAVIPSANRSKGTVRVRIKLLEQDNRIIPDMSLRVSFGKEVN